MRNSFSFISLILRLVVILIFVSIFSDSFSIFNKTINRLDSINQYANATENVVDMIDDTMARTSEFFGVDNTARMIDDMQDMTGVDLNPVWRQIRNSPLGEMLNIIEGLLNTKLIP